VRARFDFTGVIPEPVTFTSPESVIVARTVEEVLPALAQAESALAAGRHVAGWVAYEAAPALDPALVTRTPGDVPLVRFGVFRERDVTTPLVPVAPTGPLPQWHSAVDAAAHAAGVAAIRDAIARGDTYQINYTFPLLADVPTGTDFTAMYRYLAASARAPYSACLETDEWAVVSLSPELLFHCDGRTLVTRPMKGTARPGRWAEEDLAVAHTLRRSEKNRAENVMIVDLCRNDLSRVCRWGTVETTGLCEVERYPTVWQMVSTVRGELRDGSGLTDIFRAVFPAGSITGAPKTSSMRLIAALETTPRGVYCGAIGFASPDGTSVFNVAIRTMTVERSSGRATYSVGGGITWDSLAVDEHAEALQKAACLSPSPPLGLIETFRADAGTPVRLEHHLARLTASAAFLGIPCDAARILDAINAHLSSLLPSPSHRVRVVLQANGESTVTSTPYAPVIGPVDLALSTTPVDSRDRRLCHKTTDRSVYERAASGRTDSFDTILWNERGEVTECTRGNLVVELDGALVTPPRECGLLNGVFRQELLDSGVVHERVVRVDDLACASRLWFINSLREWVPVRDWRTPCP
jgi:para-aminobenzoate synthetase/4-amino-4-deoxychorismate lyase